MQVKGEMRILYITTIGETMGFFPAHIKMLKEEGHTVELAANFSQPLNEEVAQLGCALHHIPFSRTVCSRDNIRAFFAIKKLIQCRRYDIVHTHTPNASAIVRIVCRKYRKKGLKVFYTAHGFHFYKGAPLKNWILYYPIEKALSRWTDVLITINKEDYKRAKKRFCAGRTAYIPGVGVDTEKYAVCKIDKKKKRSELGVNDSDFVLLSVGELSERKNQRVVIDALYKLKIMEKLGNTVYLIAGKGGMESEFMRLIREYGLENHVKLLGHRTDIDELCKTVDCFVHTSIREGLGIAALEAMAAGVPLISSYVNGIKDYTLDGVSGCCVDPASVDDVAEAVGRMKGDKAFRDRCAGNNYKTSKHFDIQKSTELMSKIYTGGYRHLAGIVSRQKLRRGFGIRDSDFVILSVGELNDNKNHQAIIRALSCVNDRDIKYVIAGKGKLQDDLELLAGKAGLSDNVIMAGYRADINVLLKMADCFAFPSKREGLGLAAIEAMAGGLPIITSRSGGIMDYSSDGVTGYNCDAEDVEAFAQCIKKMKDAWAGEDGNFKSMSNKCVEVSEKFDIKNTNIVMKKIYKGAEG